MHKLILTCRKPISLFLSSGSSYVGNVVNRMSKICQICMTHLDHSQRLYLPKHKQQVHPIVLTGFLVSHKKLMTYRCEPHQDLKCKYKRNVICRVNYILAIGSYIIA